MTLSNEQLASVEAYFESQQLSRIQLEDDLVDHCCSGIEQLMEDPGYDFDIAFTLMKQRLVPNGAMEIEEDLEYLENYKPQTTMKKFVFASGYVSSLCMLAGLLMIVVSFFQRENMKLDREHGQLQLQIEHFTAQDLSDQEKMKLFSDHDVAQATKELSVLGKVQSRFLTGQMLMLVAVILFAVTLLPYKFYKRYQRSLADYAGS